MGLTRLDVDEWAVYSQADAIASIDSGAFVDEIVPMTVTRPDGEKVEFSVDEFPRRGVTVESLSKLPVLHPECRIRLSRPAIRPASTTPPQL